MAGLAGKTVLMTGATGGIGLAAARALAAQGARLLLVGRDGKRLEDAAAAVRVAGGEAVSLHADLSRMDDVRALAEQVRSEARLDVLVNNAGIFNQTRQLTPDGFEQTFAVNHLAPFLLTGLLRDMLETTPGARIITVSSSAQKNGHIDFDDPMGARRYAGFRAYSQSKLANVLFSNELARRLAGTDVTSNSLHPGVVNSGFGNGSRGVVGLGFSLLKRFALTPEQGADTTVYLASSPGVAGISGRYFEKRRPVPTGREAQDEGVAARLWQLSEVLTGFRWA